MRIMLLGSTLLFIGCGGVQVINPSPIQLDCLEDGDEILCGQANIHVREEAGPELPLEFTK